MNVQQDYKIYIPFNEVWDFYTDHKERLKEEYVLIAENPELEREIYLTMEEGKQYPTVNVFHGELPIYTEVMVSEADARRSVREIYTKYLFPVNADVDESDDLSERRGEYDSDSMTLQEMEDAVYERDDQLLLGMQDFLEVIFDDADLWNLMSLGEVEDLLDDFLTHLADIGFLVYRPMIIADDDTGKDVFVSYPYNDEFEEELGVYELDDEDEENESNWETSGK
jgi:hypothetical protein